MCIRDRAQTERSTRLLERALAINQRLERDGEAIKNLSYLSLIARDRGDFDLALRLNEQILTVSERRDDQRGIAAYGGPPMPPGPEIAPR